MNLKYEPFCVFDFGVNLLHKEFLGVFFTVNCASFHTLK